MKVFVYFVTCVTGHPMMYIAGPNGTALTGGFCVFCWSAGVQLSHGHQRVQEKNKVTVRWLSCGPLHIVEQFARWFLFIIFAIQPRVRFRSVYGYKQALRAESSHC